VQFSETAALLGEFGLSLAPAIAPLAPEEEEEEQDGMLNTVPPSMAIPDCCLSRLILILEVWCLLKTARH